jgi:hypothetical protein
VHSLNEQFCFHPEEALILPLSEIGATDVAGLGAPESAICRLPSANILWFQCEKDMKMSVNYMTRSLFTLEVPGN